MGQDQLLNIDTPENVVFDYEVADIGSRFLAALVDSTLIVIIIVLADLAGAVLVSLLDVDFDSVAPNIILAVSGLIAFLTFWGYYILFEIYWNGQSPGKRWQKLRVLRRDGVPISPSDAVIRNLVRIIDFLPAFYGVGLIAMFASSQARRLGDFAAGTLVVREETSITLDDLKIASNQPSNIRRYSSSKSNVSRQFPIEKLSEKDIALAEDFFKRRFELHNRTALASRIARSLTEKMELPPKTIEGLGSEEILLQILELHQKWQDSLAD